MDDVMVKAIMAQRDRQIAQIKHLVEDRDRLVKENEALRQEVAVLRLTYERVGE